MSVSLILIMRVINILFLKQETNMVEGISLMYMYTVFPDYALVCYLHMQMQTLCRAVAILITTSYSTSVKFFIEVWPRFSLQVHFVTEYTRGR